MKADAEVVAIVQAQERELRFPKFDSSVAWSVGSGIRQRFLERYAKAGADSIVVHISLFSGLALFSCAVGPGVSPDNWGWVAGKTATVKRFGNSSLLIGRRAAAKGPAGTERLQKLAPEPEFAAHGGAFPIFLSTLDYPIGVIVVSGLSQDQDHQLVVDELRSYLGSKGDSTVV